MYRRYKDEQELDFIEEHERDRMRMTQYTMDSMHGMYKRRTYKKQFAKRPRSSSFQFNAELVRKKSYSDWIDSEMNSEPE